MKDDRITPETRVVLLLVIPFLLAAFVVLYFLPGQTGELFAWSIKSHMTALVMGSGYISGGYLFMFVWSGRGWHRIAAAFPAVTIFTIAMLLATVLHWDKFDLRHFPFQVWLVLYIITPLLVPYLWLRNRSADPGTLEPGDLRVPERLRWGMRLLGLAYAGLTIFMSLFPGMAMAIWPWSLTPLTARVLGGWSALMAAGALSVSGDTRWSAWRIPLQSFSLWAALALVGTFFNLGEFTRPQTEISFPAILSLSLIALISFQVLMETRLRKDASQIHER